ncbi:MAG: hypothetical protein BZY88_10410 [SAR202 cluster bacterium Io17-Chloro-G9]|nr:MAG: hypothetical protein BZY88_10410 [SAR202 cluster bacterium Io17-Chloro-G9]
MDTFLIAIAAFIPAILLLVVIHEFGHFATARALGVKVLEFGIGFPPRAFGIYTGNTRVAVDSATRFINVDGVAGMHSGQLVKVSSTEDQDGNLVARVVEAPSPPSGLAARLPGRGGGGTQEEWVPEEYLKHEGKVRAVEGDHFVLADMLYSVNWAPLGGFVKLAGESNPDIPRSLASKSAGTRFIVLVAGPLMNLIFPIVVFTVLLMIPQEVVVGQVVVNSFNDVNAGSPGETAGLLQQDIILQANGHKIENTEDMRRATNLNGGAEMELHVLRQGREEALLVRPQFSASDSVWLVGITITLEDSRTERRSDPPWTAFAGGFTNTWEVLVLVKQAISGAVGERDAPEFSGPVGIAQITGEITREGGWTGWLIITILLSLNLAIINILPIPPLDGSRIVFVVLEWVRRGKRVPPEREGLVHLIGFVVLIGGILAITANDINRLIQGGSLLGG